MRIPASLQAFGFFGERSTPPFSITADAKQVRASKKRNGGFKNLRVYGDRDSDDNGLAGPIGPTFTRYWDSTYNNRTQWADLQGTAKAYLENPTSPFRGNIPGLYHVRSVVDTPSAYRGFPILAKQPFALRGFLFKPPKDQIRHLWQARVGRWQLEIEDGSMSMMRLAEPSETQTGWTQAAEDAMNTLLNQSNISTADENAAASYRKNIYSDIQSLNLGGSGESAYGRYFSFTFIPTEYGRLIVLDDQDKLTVIENTKQIAARSPAPFWENTNLAIRCNAGAYMWQVGWPRAASTGQWRLGPFSTQGHTPTSLGSFVYNALKDISGPGTGIEISYESAGGYWIDIVVNFTTGTANRYIPLLFALQAVILAGDRDGDSALDATPTWDSADFPTSGGSPCVRDIRPSFEGINRRVQAEVELGDINGSAFSHLNVLGDVVDDLANNHEYLEHRMVKVSANYPIINNGLIYRVRPVNMRKATPGLNRALIARPETKAILTTVDGWAQLEEHVMDYQIAGDDRYVGDLVYIVLKNAAWKEAELTGVSRTYGELIRGAVAWETWLMLNEMEANSADFLREILDQFGYGARVYQNPSTGIWTINDPPTTTKNLTTIDGTFPVAFHGSSIVATTYPGRFAVLQPYEWDRSVEDYYNIIRVEGAEDANGVPVSTEWVQPDSITINGTRTGHFIGRRKQARTVKNKALKTLSDVLKVRRSLVMRYGLKPRYHSFVSFYHEDLWPGELCTIWDIPTRIEAISNAGLIGDHMAFLLRER